MKEAKDENWSQVRRGGVKVVVGVDRKWLDAELRSAK